MFPRTAKNIRLAWLVTCLMALAAALGLQTSPASALPGDLPPDPTADIPWSAGYSGVADIQAAFNNARQQEEAQLSIALPTLTMPSQAEWDALSDSQKALWLINQERTARGAQPLDSVETNVTSVAQYFADYLLANDAFDHYADGRSPWDRLHANPAIGACYDFLSYAENLAVFVTSGSSISLPVERSIYNWIYDDGTSWGHRHALFVYPFNDNSGTTGQEGFMGIGRASGGPYQGPFPSQWNFAEIIVFNVFDPCSSWQYEETYSISGTVLDNTANPIPGVLITATGGYSAYTNSSGSYTLSTLPAGNYTLTPTSAGLTFSPASLNVTLPPNAVSQNFTGSADTYTISGTVLDNLSNPVPGVTISYAVGASVQTDGSGNYTITGLVADSYALSPFKAGYTFSPPYILLDVPPSQVGQNFIATASTPTYDYWVYLPIVLKHPGSAPVTYAISGRVTNNLGAALAGVSIADGAGHSTQTDASGNYSLSGLAAGSYTLVPTLANHTFAPVSRAVNVPPDASSQNFVGTAATPSDQRLVLFEAFLRPT